MQLGDKVAVAKYKASMAIEDVAREETELARVRVLATAMELDPALAEQFMRSQFRASKIVQRGLFLSWRASPQKMPHGTCDDLSGIRQELDLLTTAILHELKTLQTIRGRLLRSLQRRLRYRNRLPAETIPIHLNELHHRALLVAMDKRSLRRTASFLSW